MSPPDFQTLADVVNALGTLGLALLAIVGFLRGWIVPKFIYDREVKRGDDALRLVTEQGGAFDKALELLDHRGRS